MCKSNPITHHNPRKCDACWQYKKSMHTNKSTPVNSSQPPPPSELKPFFNFSSTWASTPPHQHVFSSPPPTGVIRSFSELITHLQVVSDLEWVLRWSPYQDTFSSQMLTGAKIWLISCSINFDFFFAILLKRLRRENLSHNRTNNYLIGNYFEKFIFTVNFSFCWMPSLHFSLAVLVLTLSSDVTPSITL